MLVHSFYCIFIFMLTGFDQNLKRVSKPFKNSLENKRKGIILSLPILSAWPEPTARHARLLPSWGLKADLAHSPFSSCRNFLLGPTQPSRRELPPQVPIPLCLTDIAAPLLFHRHVGPRLPACLVVSHLPSVFGAFQNGSRRFPSLSQFDLSTIPPLSFLLPSQGYISRAACPCKYVPALVYGLGEFASSHSFVSTNPVSIQHPWPLGPVSIWPVSFIVSINGCRHIWLQLRLIALSHSPHSPQSNLIHPSQT